MSLSTAKQQGDAVRVDIWYPRNSEIKAAIIGLVDVRAADDIRIEYDFGRDGWIISQQVFAHGGQDEIDEPPWKEVAFIEAWASNKEE